MNILVSKVPRTLIQDFGQTAYVQSLGLLVTPRSRTEQIRYVAALGAKWAADNDAFSAFDERGYLRMLAQISGIPGCLFVTAPDVVFNALATFVQFARWHRTIRAFGLPIAYVAQNGQERMFMPWDYLDTLFIGGDTAWKLGSSAAALVREAKRRGKHVHMGRCNSNRRLLYATTIGCDSVDGTGYAKFSKDMLPRAIAATNTRQHALWEGLKVA